jgi:hypothetical protein
VHYNFEQLVKRCLCQYDIEHLLVNFVGSIAVVFEDILTEVLEEHGVNKGVVIGSPIEAIVKELMKEQTKK